MRKLLSVVYSLLLAVPCLGQEIQGITHRKLFTPLSLAFVTYTFVANTNCGSTCTSITTPALTLSANDFVYIFCRNGGTSNSMTMTSTPANTFTHLTSRFQSGIGTERPAYAFGVASGSTTFTCTPVASNNSMDMVVLQYHPGFLTVNEVDTPGANLANVTDQASNIFSTTAAGLIIWCVTDNAVGIVFTGGTVGSGTGTLRGFSAASNSSDTACEDTTPGASQTSIQAHITAGVAHGFNGTVAAFK